ncbi:hypothetical protein BDA96_05G192100 [Sorghum bicolor]|uniref:VWFA domain-containing protein n=1 Tax=Sorghum bicolor TaxID=4558 RepID=A0A921UFX8_SORBI|nr:hypothetical protein BDA96_05G192100 [Sorghum bicolor]
MSSFNDDEPLPENPSAAGPRLSMNAERVRLVAYCNDKAPLGENTQQVLLELTDTSSTAERSGLDLVAVLDVSGSMGFNGNWKLEKLKTAMKFVISKLGPLDRLSIVSFSDSATRLCELRSMTDAGKAKLTDIVDTRLEADASTNMHAGLVTALEVLDGRRLKSGRVASVLFMSDGKPEGHHPDATALSIGAVAVYTFGFGAGTADKERSTAVLEAIAGNSLGGTFYNVDDEENLSEHFSALLAGLLSVAVQDLKLTVTEQQGHSRIRKVDAGGYATEPNNNSVNFGYLYNGEVRKVIVDLVLPAVNRAYHAPVLTAYCTYSVKGQPFYSPRSGYLSCSISRTGSAKAAAMETAEEVKVELIRRRLVNKFGEAIAANGMDAARGKLEEADTALRAERSRHPLIDLLKAELAKLLTLTTWEKLVARLRAAKRSHDFQRSATRGNVSDTIIFKPRRMNEYVDQARKFDQDPSRPPPSVEEEESSMAVADDRRRPQEQPRRGSRVWAWSSPRERSSSGWAWATVLLCMALAVGVILAGVAVFAVYIIYRPSMPYLAVSNARLERLEYGQDGAIDYLQASITVVTVNNNSKADASFSSMDLVVGFHGTDVALLRARPFVVPRESSLPLPYRVVSAGRALDAAGMQAMDEALKAGVVPFDLFGKARTQWKVGVFANLRFWMRISCRLRFVFPGNGTVVAADRDKCRSR